MEEDIVVWRLTVSRLLQAHLSHTHTHAHTHTRTHAYYEHKIHSFAYVFGFILVFLFRWFGNLPVPRDPEVLTL